VAAREGLPGEGLLLFFYDAEQGTWGFDPKDAGSFAVIYLPESTPPSAVVDWPADLPEHACYRACGLASEETVLLPPWESVWVHDLELDREQLDAYQDVLEAASGDDALSSRGLLG
jgi:uncharacterized protein YwqG